MCSGCCESVDHLARGGHLAIFQTAIYHFKKIYGIYKIKQKYLNLIKFQNVFFRNIDQQVNITFFNKSDCFVILYNNLKLKAET